MTDPDVPTAVRDLIVRRRDGRADGEDWTENYQDLPGDAGVSIMLGRRQPIDRHRESPPRSRARLTVSEAKLRL